MKLKQLDHSLHSHGDQLANTGMQMSMFLTVPLAMAGKAAIDLASTYSEFMNVLQATSGASQKEISQLDKLAQELGADLTLPATSAADAAEAMLELSKSGLSVNNVMDASRAVLQLDRGGATLKCESCRDCQQCTQYV